MDSPDQGSSPPPTKTQYNISGAPNPLKDTLVQLNFGGQEFLTTSSTLFNFGSNFLTQMVSGSIPSRRLENGAYFIDR